MPIQFNHLGHAPQSPPTGGGFGTKMQPTGTLLRVGNTEMQPSATHKPVTSKAYPRGPVTGGLPLSAWAGTLFDQNFVRGSQNYNRS